ncbi:AAA family ATPase, partial [Candidatus Micrarchaeota archaeon]|nr:AAA family ATPase [Candidatus Micrarchaeota archaeon]
MILSLKLKHWKSHEDSELNFVKGTNLLVGPIGAGKSSVIDGVCFALFGTFPALKSRRVSLEEVITQRPKKFMSANVELKFECQGKQYSILRSISERGSSAYLRERDRLLEGPQSQRVTEAVERILKVDYELFVRAIYSEQNRIDYFLTLGKGDRKKQIDELLGIDRFEGARSNSSTLINRLKTIRDESLSFLKGVQVEDVEKKYDGLVKEIEALKEETEKCRKSIEAKKKEFEEGRVELKRTEAVEQEFRELEKALAALKGSLKAMEQTLLEKKRLLKKEFGRNTIESEEKNLKERLLDLRKKEKVLAELKALATGLEESLKFISEERKRMVEAEGKDFEEEKKTLQEMEELIRNKKEKLKELQKEQNQLSAELIASGGRLEELNKLIAEKALLEEEKRKLLDTWGLNLEERVSELKKALEEAQRDANNKDARMIESRNSLEALSKETAACPVCDTPLTEERRKALLLEKEKALSM